MVSEGIFINGEKVTFNPENILNGDVSAYTEAIGEATQDWLDEHLEPGGSVPIDDTLSISGAAADAKKTGDEISELKEDLSKITQVEYTSEEVTKDTDGLLQLNGYIRNSSLSSAGKIDGGTQYVTYYFQASEDIRMYVSGTSTLCLRISDEEPIVGLAYSYTGNLYDNKANNLPTESDPITVEKDKYIAIWNGAKDWTIFYTSSTGGSLVLKSTLSLTERMEQEVRDITDVKTWYYGKTINWIGDSITAGSDFDEIVAAALGMIENDYGINGSTIAVANNPNIRNPIVLRYQNMADADIIAVSAGTNDYQYAFTPIGDINSNENSTFYGALKNLCEGLINKYPQKLIFFTTPIKRAQAFESGNGGEYTADGIQTTPFSKNKYGKTLMDYADIIKEVCGYYSIPVLDLNRESQLNPHIIAQQNMFDAELTHPNQAGRVMMARRVTGWLLQLAYYTS